ncbi:NADPH-dependent FMN reductase [Atopococcus tabaci]|uniref:NADPH-dependent FMN reductase n=1 Tax=Atopococcus tabaci TaxID=269774 RepID=UPI0003F56735|nr:NAD(P)H-dependent oxidoreductase [Atopococcus tabaci]
MTDKKVTVVEVALRDGSHAIRHQYMLDQVRDITKGLEEAKVPAEYAEAAQQAVQAWSEKMASFDAYIFVTPEYNHAVGGALKNATDYLKPEVANKPAALVGYGSLGGARAHENMSVFQPNAYHEANAEGMFSELLAWANVFVPLHA